MGMKKPIAVFRYLPGRGWLLLLLILLAVYGGVRLGRREAVETMTGEGESSPPQSFFDTVCRMWED